MKLYAKFHPTIPSYTVELRTIEDGFVLDAPWVLQTPEYTATWLAAQTPEPPPPAGPEDSVPESVTPRQMRRALNQLGLRNAVEAAVAAGSQNPSDDWEYALELRRDNADLNAMAAQLGMTDAQIDDLFRLAAEFY